MAEEEELGFLLCSIGINSCSVCKPNLLLQFLPQIWKILSVCLVSLLVIWLSTHEVVVEKSGEPIKIRRASREEQSRKEVESSRHVFLRSSSGVHTSFHHGRTRIVSEAHIRPASHTQQSYRPYLCSEVVKILFMSYLVRLYKKLK